MEGGGERVNEIKRKKKAEDQTDSRLVQARAAVTPAFMYAPRRVLSPVLELGSDVHNPMPPISPVFDFDSLACTV